MDADRDGVADVDSEADRLDGERWENDWSADEYVANAYGSDDSVVSV